MKIDIVSNPNLTCGVAEYGRRLCRNLQDSKFQFNLVTTYDFNSDANIILFNWHQATLPWLNTNIVRKLQESGKKVGIIPHNKNYPDLSVFDFVIQDDCTLKDSNREIGLPRVIPSFEPKTNPIPYSVGFFGFIFPHKNLIGLAEKVEKEYGSKGILRIKSTPYPGHEHYFWECVNHISQRMTLQAEINTDYLGESDLIEYISKNEINVFPYKEGYDAHGQSSTIDLALACKRPICVSDCKLFSHIHHIPKISFERNSLKEIVEDGTQKFEDLYRSWTKESLILKVESLIERTCL